MEDFVIIGKRENGETTAQFGGSSQSPATIYLAMTAIDRYLADNSHFNHWSDVDNAHLEIRVTFLTTTQKVTIKNTGFSYELVKAIVEHVDNQMNS